MTPVREENRPVLSHLVDHARHAVFDPGNVPVGKPRAERHERLHFSRSVLGFLFLSEECSVAVHQATFLSVESEVALEVFDQDHLLVAAARAGLELDFSCLQGW
jgi:hypothetical protein